MRSTVLGNNDLNSRKRWVESVPRNDEYSLLQEKKMTPQKYITCFQQSAWFTGNHKTWLKRREFASPSPLFVYILEGFRNIVDSLNSQKIPTLFALSSICYISKSWLEQCFNSSMLCLKLKRPTEQKPMSLQHKNVTTTIGWTSRKFDHTHTTFAKT